MLEAFTRINWLAVLVAVVVSTVLGGLYFGALVAKAYLRVLGREERSLPKPSVVLSIGQLVCGVLVVLASAVLAAALHLATVTDATVTDAVVFGLVVGIGYLVAMTVQIAINPNFPHPLRYGALNAPYFLVTSLTTSLLLVLI